MKSYFNSSMERDDYAVIRDEAYKAGLTIKEYISSVLTQHATLKRKEELQNSNAGKEGSPN